MPQAVTHFLIPAILINLFRDYFIKKKKRFSLRYVLIGGLAGILPDLDIAAYYVLGFFGFTINELHRTFSHSIFIPMLFVLLGFVFYSFKNKELGKHHLKLHTILFVIAFGIFMHLILDVLVYGQIMPLYPFSNYSIGAYMINLLPDFWRSTILPVFDAALLVLWLVYLELKHKISDFI